MFVNVLIKATWEARVRCAWAKFKDLSPIVTARIVSHEVKDV